MSRRSWLAILGAGRLAGDGARGAGAAAAVYRLVYPAGGQQGTTFQVRLGGQGLDDVNEVLVTGTGVSAKVVEYCRRLGNQEMQLLSEQLSELKRELARRPRHAGAKDEAGDEKLIARIEKRMAEYVQHAGLRRDRQPGVRRGHDRARCRARRAGTAAGDAARRVEPAGLPRRPGARSLAASR